MTFCPNRPLTQPQKCAGLVLSIYELVNDRARAESSNRPAPTEVGQETQRRREFVLYVPSHLSNHGFRPMKILVELKMEDLLLPEVRNAKPFANASSLLLRSDPLERCNLGRRLRDDAKNS